MKLSTSLLSLGALLALALLADQVHHLWVLLLGLLFGAVLVVSRRAAAAYSRRKSRPVSASATGPDPRHLSVP